MSRSSPTVAFIGGHWSGNIGNAYYNLGALKLLKDIFGNEAAYLIPDPPGWRHSVSDDFDLISRLDVDLVLFGGPIMNLRLPKVLGRTLMRLQSKGKSWGFLSAGMALYDWCEVEALIPIMKKNPPICCFTRDRRTFEFFSPHLTHCFDGICTSAFLSQCQSVPSLDHSPYVIANLDSKTRDKVAVEAIAEEGLGGHDVVWISSESIESGTKSLFKRSNSYHSDLPYGYMSLMAGAACVFSDRVHTCAAALALGGHARYLVSNKRSSELRRLIFDRLGVGALVERSMSYDPQKIRLFQEEMIMEMKEVRKRLMKPALDYSESNDD